MRGLNIQQNILLCSYDGQSGSPNEWLNEQENTIEIPGSVGYDMPSTNRQYYLFDGHPRRPEPLPVCYSQALT
jgi:hypothetical protein